MSEEKREAKNEWIETKDGRAKFWATANELKLSKDEAHQSLHFVESCYDFTGTLDEALKLLAAYTELKARAVEKVTETAQGNALFDAVCKLPESPGVAWTKVQKGPGGPVWSITIRAGLPPELASEMLRIMLKEMGNVEKWLDINETFRPVYNSHEMAASAVPAPAQQQPPRAKASLPGKVDGEFVPPPPPTSTGNGTPPPPKEPGAQQFENIDRLSIRGSKAKPKVEFWRDGRQFAELYWNQGGKYLLEKTPVLATVPVQEILADGEKPRAGLTAEMLDDTGSDYKVSLKVYWTQSPKNPKWKDIAGAIAR